jgi:hypothetical protein
LSESGTVVVAAGRLLVSSSDAAGVDVTWSEERCPSVGMSHDGVLMLAYIAIPMGQRPGGLWLAPITVESRAGNPFPRVEASAARLLTPTSVAAPPAFSADGRWIYAAVRETPDGEVRLKQFAIAPPRVPDDSRRSLTAQPRFPSSSG